MGSDAAHRPQAAQTGSCHQATVVRLVLVSDALLLCALVTQQLLTFLETAALLVHFHGGVLQQVLLLFCNAFTGPVDLSKLLKLLNL